MSTDELRRQWAEITISHIRYGFEGGKIEGNDDLKALKDEERTLKRIVADAESRLAGIRRQLASALPDHNCTMSPMDGCIVCDIIHS